MTKCYVYQHRRLDNGNVFYVGIGSDPSFKRAYNKVSRTKYWKNIANKGYSVEIIHMGLDWNNACEIEQKTIQSYGRIDIGTGILVNMTNGGEGALGAVMSNDAKLKISIASIGNKKGAGKRTQEFREKLRLIATGRSHTMETRVKMSQNKKGVTTWNATAISAFQNERFVGCFKSIESASVALKCDSSLIRKVLIGERNHTGGFTFKNVNDVFNS